MDGKPPPYANSGSAREVGSKNDSHDVLRYNFADEVAVYRSYHVAVAVSEVLDVLESRARYGISQVLLLLVPKNQIDLSRGHEIIELEDIKYTLVELKRDADSAEFWSQAKTIQELKSRITENLNDGEIGGPNLIKVEVELRKCHFRTESEFGLAETMAVNCIVVEFDS